jgi:AcrR family transcriptional regulator
MGTEDRRKRERAEREEQILNAAEQVFFQRGFERSTMDDVAVAAELSKGSLYTYFTNKNELCIGIVVRSLRLLLQDFEAVFNREGCTGLEKVILFGKALQRFAQKQPKYYCALLSYRQHCEGCRPESRFKGMALAENGRIRKMLESALLSGQEDGSVRKSILPESASAALWGEFGGLLPGFILNSNDGDAASFDYALELLRAGLRNEQHCKTVK